MNMKTSIATAMDLGMYTDMDMDMAMDMGMDMVIEIDMDTAMDMAIYVDANTTVDMNKDMHADTEEKKLVVGDRNYKTALPSLNLNAVSSAKYASLYCKIPLTWRFSPFHATCTAWAFTTWANRCRLARHGCAVRHGCTRRGCARHGRVHHRHAGRSVHCVG